MATKDDILNQGRKTSPIPSFFTPPSEEDVAAQQQPTQQPTQQPPQQDTGGQTAQTVKKPVTTAEASDPTKVVQQKAAQTTQTPAKPPFNDPSVLNVNGKQPTFTATGTNSDLGKDTSAAAVDLNPKGKSLSYAEMYQAMNPYTPPTKEEIEKERKKEKRERLFAAIGDGISALSNLYFTTRGAPNMYTGQNTQSGAVADRWDKFKKERDENYRRYVDGYLKARQADDLQAIRKQNADVAEAYKKADTDRKNAIAKAQQESIAARANKDQAAAELADKKLEYLIAGFPAQQAEQQAKIDLLKAKKKATEAQARNSDASADEHNRRGTSSWVGSSSGGHGGSGGKSGGGIPWYDKNGNLHYAKTEAEAKQQSKQNGTYVDDYATNKSNMVGSDGKQIGIGTSRTTHSGWHSRKPATPAKPTRPATPTKPAAQGGRSSGGGKSGGGGRSTQSHDKKSTGVHWK